MTETVHTPEALAEAIRRVAEHAGSEMELQVEVEKLLDPFLPKVPGVTLDRYGHATKLGGIKDALHGNLIIEYKRPGKLSKHAGVEANAGQLQRYLLEEAARHGHQSTAALRRMVGVGLDGEQILFVRYRGRQPAAVTVKKPKPQLTFFGEPEGTMGDFSVDGPHPVSAESIDIFLGFLQSLARYPLTPEALAETFGPKSDIAQRVVGLFYSKLLKTTNRRAETFFAEWQRIFGIVYGQDIGKAETDARALGRQFGVKTVPKLKEFLFAVHTYFALLMKLLAAELMTMQSGSMLRSFIQPLGSMSSDDFRKALKDLEDGGLFSRQGINNFLEGDFFAWYLSEWDKAMAQELRGLAKALASFDPRTPFLAPEQSRDLLKKLYQYLVPKKLRHDLGEFYTPDWLAEHLLNQLGYDGDLDKRLLDPACGSGTFLVLAIKRMKQWAEDHDPPIAPDLAARKILDNLCGFDLNPIAVIAARTNFLLALGELVRYVRPIEIPIYMCDSVLTPSEYAELFKKGYRIPTGAGEFEIPGEIVTSNQMEKLAALLEQCARGDYSPREFLNRVKRELAITLQATFDGLKALYEAIHKLEKQKRNGIWARWLKNAFAPLFKGKFDFIAGNPPWINWESLSDQYRSATRKLWGKYGLFSLKGHAARLGGGKKDFSMLFTYAAVDNYLLDGGKLGFLITQTVFQTKGAGAGFRRFRVGTRLPLKVSLAEDLVSINPFEGASNWSGLVILTRGEHNSYPVEYIRWGKGEKGEVSPDLSLEEALRSCDRTPMLARPVSPDDPCSPWQTFSKTSAALLSKISGNSPYKARAGITTWLDGMFWLRVIDKRPDGLVVVENMPELGKKDIGPRFKTSIESDLLYPFVRWEDIHQYSALSAHCILVTQDPKTRRGIDVAVLKSRLPNTFAYLKRFERQLSTRSGYLKYFRPDTDPFYSVYNVGPESFAPLKTVWKTMGPRIEAAVLEPMAHRALPRKVPFHKNTVMFIPLTRDDEAHYLAAVLNSAALTFAAKSYSVKGGKGFGATNLLEYVRIPKFLPKERVHTKLAELSQRAHDLASRLVTKPDDKEAKRELAQVEDQVDRAAAALWGLTDAELDEIRKALELLS
jgi:hypothetical protein